MAKLIDTGSIGENIVKKYPYMDTPVYLNRLLNERNLVEEITDKERLRWAEVHKRITELM